MPSQDIHSHFSGDDSSRHISPKHRQKPKSSSPKFGGVFSRKRKQQHHSSDRNAAPSHNTPSQVSDSKVPYTIGEFLPIPTLITKSDNELHKVLLTLTKLCRDYTALSTDRSVGKKVQRAIDHVVKAKDILNKVEVAVRVEEEALKRNPDAYTKARRRHLLYRDLDYVPESHFVIAEILERYKASQITHFDHNDPRRDAHAKVIDRLEKLHWATSMLIGEMDAYN